MLLECLLFGLIVTLLIIIISIIIGADFNLRETLTVVRRTVGAYVGPDSTVLPAKVPDYRNVWTDGIKIYSCDECPNKETCPNCPKYRTSSIESLSGGESPDPAAGKNLDKDPDVDQHNDALIALDAPVRLAQSIQAEFRPDELSVLGAPMTNALVPAYDLDPEFVSSRARMGAGCGSQDNRSKLSIRGLTYDTATLGTKNDDLFDGDRKVVCNNKGAGSSSLKLLYTNVMGIDNPKPFTASCEFLGSQGYLYKETCALGTVYPK